MFIGHFALGFGAKRAAPSVSLGVLFAAAQLADLLWPTLVLLGIERLRIAPGITEVTPLDFVSYPYSHSLVLLCVWGALFGFVYVAARRAPLAAGLTIALLVVSHWLLDYVTHRPDMPLAPWDAAKVGLGLWNSRPATVIVEGALFAAGVAAYVSAPRTRVVGRPVALWSLVGFLLIIYAANLFGPPPPSVSAVAWSAEALWLLVVWGWWADRSRRTDGSTRSAGGRVYREVG